MKPLEVCRILLSQKIVWVIPPTLFSLSSQNRQEKVHCYFFLLVPATWAKLDRTIIFFPSPIFYLINLFKKKNEPLLHGLQVALQSSLGRQHVLLTSTVLGTLQLSVFVRRELVWLVSLPETDEHSLRRVILAFQSFSICYSICLCLQTFCYVINV